MGRTKPQIIDETTEDYLANLTPQNHPDPEKIAKELTEQIETYIDMENAFRGKGKGFRAPETLTFYQIATIMCKLYSVATISCAGADVDPDYDLLAMYAADGPDAGTYVTSEIYFYRLARRFNSALTSSAFEELMKVLRAIAPRKERCMDRDLIAVNNGIFNYATKQLEPFSPDYVFLAKSHVDYNPNAVNVVIHNPMDNTDWDVESWIKELSDDDEIIDVLWQILGAIIRPLVRWNKSAWFYSEEGNNGKGTLCELMRCLCGRTAYTAIPLSNFGKDFALEPLTRSTAIIVDENDVGTFIDKAANLKAVITGDVISINRKFKQPISYQFYGFMVQCLNEFPRIKDKSNSFYRRQLFIPFTKCFTGAERRYIKDDYVHRKEVLEYVLYRVLNMNYYVLSEPQACSDILSEYKEFNDPVRQYYEELKYRFTWDLLPFPFLYELYKAWVRKNSPNGTILGKQKFISEIVTIANADGDWYCTDKTKTIRSQGRMIGPEPLIYEFGLEDWKSPTYVGTEINRISTPRLQDYYRGLLRTANNSGRGDAGAVGFLEGNAESAT